MAMRIAFSTQSLSRAGGGLFSSVQRVAQSLQSIAGLDVRVTGPRDAFTDEDLDSWKPLAPAALSVLGPPQIGYTPGLQRWLDQTNPDLVCSHGLWTYPSAACHRWGRRTGRPQMVTPHGMLDAWALGNSAWKKRVAAALFERAHLESAACLHALCGPEVDAIRRYGLKNPVCVVPNGVDLPTLPETPPPIPFQDVPSDARVLLYLGRLHLKKRVSELIAAWEIFQRQSSRAQGWHLVIAGWGVGDYEKELKSAAVARGVTGTVHFPGPLYAEAKTAALCSASGFVLPSLSEGLPMAVLEAWAHAVPVLMTPECNLGHGFDAGAAIRIEAEPQSIARGIDELAALGDSARAGMGRSGRRIAADGYSWKNVATDLRDVYAWLTGGGAKPGCVF